MKPTTSVKTHLLIAMLFASALFTASSAKASVTINFELGTMYSSTNTSTVMPVGGIINILAWTNGTGWATNAGALSNLFTSLTNSFVPTGAILVGQITNDALLPGVTDGHINYSYAGSFQPGVQLLAVVYPSLTASDTAPGVGTVGFFYRTDSILNNSDIAWIAPADGSTYSLNALTTDVSGSLSTNQFTSGAGAAGGNGFTTASAVPEPSTSALIILAMLTGAVVFRRSRRTNSSQAF
jgi:hypothetical protein